MSIWTPENVEILRRMWGDHSAQDISVALNCGISRSAVLGKVHRLGMSKPRRVPLGPNLPRSGKVHALGRSVRESRPPAPVSAIVVSIACVMVTVDELDDATCRWPVGDPKDSEFRYCGSPKHVRESYCRGHGGLAYRPSSVRESRDYHLRRLA